MSEQDYLILIAMVTGAPAPALVNPLEIMAGQK